MKTILSRSNLYSLLTCLLLVCFSFLNNNLKACDTSPVLTASNVTDIGGGFFTFDMQVCLGADGSQDGFDLTMNCGLNVTATSAAALNNGGNIATASIAGGVLTYSYLGFPPVWWEADDNVAGPCFTFTVTVDGDPSSCVATVTGINDGCLVIATSWAATVPGSCSSDFSVTAPASQAGTTVGAGNNCALRGSQDQIIEVVLPCDETYRFSLCGNATWDTYLYLSNSCCGASVALNDDACSVQSRITSVLTAGTYYVTIEAFSSGTTGAYTLDVTSLNPCALPVEMLTFKGNMQTDNTNLISWTTSSEINNDYFVLERGKQEGERIIWAEIGTIEGKGNSHELINYSFVDMIPNVNELNYYRLNQFDFDGSSKYSKNIVVQNVEENDFVISNLYPNPANNNFSFSLLKDVKEENMSVTIYNSLGVVAKTETFLDVNPQSEFNVDVVGLSKGVYFVNIVVGETKQVKKITIVR